MSPLFLGSPLPPACLRWLHQSPPPSHTLCPTGFFPLSVNAGFFIPMELSSRSFYPSELSSGTSPSFSRPLGRRVPLLRPPRPPQAPAPPPHSDEAAPSQARAAEPRASPRAPPPVAFGLSCPPPLSRPPPLWPQGRVALPSLPTFSSLSLLASLLTASRRKCSLRIRPSHLWI